MATPKLDLHKIRGHFAPHIYERGRAYQESGDVLNLSLRGNLLLASVQGSDVQPYHVTVELTEDDFITATCSCPYGENFGDLCKHIAAVVLEFHHQPDHVISETSITDLLAPLDADTLRGALAALLRRYPEMLDRLELYLQKERLEHGDAQAEKADPTPAEAAWVESGQTKTAQAETAQAEVPPAEATLDTRLFEKMMRSAVRGTSWDWDGFPEYGEVYTVVEEIDPFLARGAYRDALDLTEALIKTLIDAINSLENAYEGIGFSDESLFLDLDTRLTEAIFGVQFTGALSETASKRLLYEVLAWNDQIDNEWTSPDFNLAAHALVQSVGEDEEAQELRDEVADLRIARGNFDEIRLRALRATGRGDEALAFAETTGQGADYLTLLLERGQLDELRQTYRDHLTDAEGALRVVEALAEGHPGTALEVAQYGLSLPEPERPSFGYTAPRTEFKRKLATFAKDLALRLGDKGAALEAGVAEFRLEPSLPRYHALRTHAAADWPELRLELLNHLRGADYAQQHAAVDIFLAENRHDEAIEIASQSYADRSLVQRVMAAVTPTHPLWVRNSAERRAAEIMDAGRSGAYDEAATWLGYARDAYIAGGQDEAWRAYLAGVREKHARKYKLMAALKRF